MRNWKSRKKANIGKPYAMKIHRNYLNPDFDPVFWLMAYLSYQDATSGPLFQDNGQGLSVDTWTGMTDHLFEAAGLRTKARSAEPANESTGAPARPAVAPSGCTNHSIRRSAAQWAGRCGARELDVRNAGRWKSMKVLATYMAQGALQRDEYEDSGDAATLDPIFKTWVFKKVTNATEAGSRDIMCFACRILFYMCI